MTPIKKNQLSQRMNRMTPNNLHTIVNSNSWIMPQSSLESLVMSLPQIASKKGEPSFDIQTSKPMYINNKGEAIIKISGVLMKSVPSIFKWFEIDATGYDDIVSQIDAAVLDSKIKTITLNITSPGGTVAGVQEAAQAILSAKEIKPINAVIEDLCASGAYWLASQATSIQSNQLAQIGSIGVYTVLADWSKYYEDAGVKIQIIKSGEFKGTGVEGTEITDKQLEPIQERIDAMAAVFVEAVATGRKMEISDIQKLATGRMWIAESAKANGLIDGIVQFKSKNNVNTKGNVMDEKEIQAAIESAKNEQADASVKSERERLASLKAEFSEDLSFALEQFEAGASLEQAKAAYCDVLKQKMKEKESDGAEALETDGDTSQVKSDDFMTLAKEYKSEHKCSLTKAMQVIAKERPELYRK